MQDLKFCEKELTKVVPGGVVGAAVWIVCIGMYKNNTICKNYCFSYNTFILCPEMAGGGL